MIGAMELDDVDGDGDLDAITVRFPSNIVTIIVNQGDAEPTTTEFPTAAGPASFGVAAGDFNGDGHVDVAIAMWTGGVAVHLGA
jgi:hypothetical protein